jgi:hypothetical protein
MSVRMRHPDLEGQEITVASSAAPLHALSGWVAVEGQDDMGEELPAELQPFEGQPTFLMRHPDVEGDPVIAAESQVPFYRERGWLLVEEEEAAEVEDLDEEATLEDLTVVQLQDRARELGLPVSGTKAELVERISGQQEQAESEVEETEEDE